MTIIQIVILVFILLEFSNVITLYFVPGSKKANGIGFFTAWEKSKQDPEVHDFVKYLVNWIAGTKLIFIALLIVIIIFAEPATQRISLVALMVTTATFYWRLFPLIKKMDGKGQIEPKNYSVVLGVMIGVFITVFLIAVLV